MTIGRLPLRNITESGMQVGTNAGVICTLAGVTGSKLKLADIIGESDANTVVEIRKELTGTVSTAVGDATVTGTGTLFTTELAAGNQVRITDTGELLTVSSVTTALAFEATGNSGNNEASSKIYKIVAKFSILASDKMPDITPGMIESISGLGLQVAILTSTTDCHLNIWGGITQ